MDKVPNSPAAAHVRCGLSQPASVTAGAACGGLLFAAVGAIAHLQTAGALAGAAVGAVVGWGLWADRISVMTVGGTFGAVFFSLAACVPTGMFAPFGFVIGYCVTFVLRAIWRGIRGPDPRRQWLTWLWIAWVASIALWLGGSISGLVPAYGVIVLLALEAGPEPRRPGPYNPDAQ